jgi:hypothetical protein
MSQDADNEPVRTHQQVKIGSRKDCVYCKGLRHRDRPQKRVALAEIAANKRRESKRTCTSFGCKQYDVAICKNSSCWEIYHSISWNWRLFERKRAILLAEIGSLNLRTDHCVSHGSWDDITLLLTYIILNCLATWYLTLICFITLNLLSYGTLSYINSTFINWLTRNSQPFN